MTSQALTTKLPSKSRAELLNLAARMAEEVEKIGGRMRERREELHLKQREVAERLPGTHQAADISRWERGQHRPEILSEIAAALETTTADLISGPLAEREEPESKDLMDSLASAEPPSLAEKLDEVLDQQALILAELSAVRDELKRLRSLPKQDGRGRASRRS